MTRLRRGVPPAVAAGPRAALNPRQVQLRPCWRLQPAMKQSAAVTIQPGQRAVVLTERRNLKMAESAHAYVRGSTLRFYEWLEDSRRVALPEGPAVWICGDCHAGPRSCSRSGA